MSMVAAAAATSRCPGRFWGHSKNVPEESTPSPPRHFTFEPLPAPRGPARPRRKCRRVLYPPVARRPLPTDRPDAAKRLLLLLLALVGAQVYHAPSDVTDGDSGSLLGSGSPLGSGAVLGTPQIPAGPRIPAENSTTSNGTTTAAATSPSGATCPSPRVSHVLSPPGGLRTH